MATTQQRPLRIALAETSDMHAVFRLRHTVYADELGQYEPRVQGLLPDRDGLSCIYVCAWDGTSLIGFIGVTPPESDVRSVDAHVSRDEIPLPDDHSTFEIRALTVEHTRRGSLVAPALMYGAFRLIEARGGQHIVSLGRREVLAMYTRLGMQTCGRTVSAGSVSYELMVGDVDQIARHITARPRELARLEARLEWRLPCTFAPPPRCYHGGAFFTSIGERFDALERRHHVIPADVLDAWFAPSPSVVETLREHLEWVCQTSPPTHASGVVSAIAERRGVPEASVLPGAGSSDLIFLAMRHLVPARARVLLLDPTYGEYRHVLEHLLQCRVDSLTLRLDENYDVDLIELEALLANGYDLMVWVNPNSPTGRHVERADVMAVIDRAPSKTVFWIDETYVEYVGQEQSLETLAVQPARVVVCKSLSKVYALSGLRAAYLCGPPTIIETLRPLTPPWAMSLPAQLAAVAALDAQEYYQGRYALTHQFREELTCGLRRLGAAVVPGCANFVLMHIPMSWGTAAEVIERCRRQDLFLRDASAMGEQLGTQAIRIAVRDQETNNRMLTILSGVADDARPRVPD